VARAILLYGLAAEDAHVEVQGVLVFGGHPIQFGASRGRTRHQFISHRKCGSEREMHFYR
jgi:hypothetical protein